MNRCIKIRNNNENITYKVHILYICTFFVGRREDEKAHWIFIILYWDRDVDHVFYREWISFVFIDRGLYGSGLFSILLLGSFFDSIVCVTEESRLLR